MIPALNINNCHQINESEINFNVGDGVRRCNSHATFQKFIEKSLIIHRDENGFGLRVKGHLPVFIEHVHENGAAWRAGVRKFDRISKINGTPVIHLDHKEVVLMFKNCIRFVSLTLLSRIDEYDESDLVFCNSKCDSLCSHRFSFGLKNGCSEHISSASNSTRRYHHISLSNKDPRNQLNNYDLISYHDDILEVPSASSKRALSGKLNQAHAKRSESITVRSSYSTRSDSADQSKQDKSSNFRSCVTNQVDDKANLFCISCRSPLKASFDSLTCYECRLTIANQAINTRFHYSTRDFDNSNGYLNTFAHSKKDQSNFYRDIKQTAKNKFVQSLSSNSLLADRNDINSSHNFNGSSKSPKSKPVTNKRLEIIKELIDTEKTHTEKLKCLDELFYKPLKVDGLMTPEQLKMVFSCHRQLYKIHRQIYRTLLSANNSINGEPLIGSALIEIFEGDLKRRLDKATCLFCACQATNADLLNKLTRKDTKVGQFLTQVANQQMVGRLGVKDLLASCFQRLTKYPLLLENLLKSTPTSSALTAAAKQTSNCNGSSSGIDNYDDETNEMIALSFSDERQFIARALHQSRQILVHVNETIQVAISHHKLKEIWKRTDKHPGVPLIDISKQQVVHEGPLTLRLSKRSFDVYVLLLSDYIIILTREGQDKYRLKFFSPDGKSSANQQCVYSPVFVIDEHLTTRDAATDENGFYLLCKRKDDSRIYEFATRSPAERIKWRDRIHWTVDRQINKSSSDSDRRLSSVSTVTKSSSEISCRPDIDSHSSHTDRNSEKINNDEAVQVKSSIGNDRDEFRGSELNSKIEGTISYVEDDGIVMPSNLNYTSAFVNQAIQIYSNNQTQTSRIDDLSANLEQKLKTT